MKGTTHTVGIPVFSIYTVKYLFQGADAAVSSFPAQCELIPGLVLGMQFSGCSI